MAVNNNKPAYIYCITNLVNGKKYVGKTSSPLGIRWSQHVHTGLHDDDRTPLKDAIRKYGRENFSLEILATYATDQEAFDAEDGWIEKMQSRVSQHGYNLKGGGRGGEVLCEKLLDRMVEVRKGKNLKGEKQLLVERAVELNAEGLTNAEIGRLIGRVPSQVKEYLDQQNIKSHGNRGRNRQTRVNEIGAEVIRLREECGWSYRRIEIELKSSKKVVARIYQDYVKWKSDGKRELPWDCRKVGDRIVALRRQGATWKQVCAEVGCKECTAMRVYRQMTGQKAKTQSEIQAAIERKCIAAKWLKSIGFYNRDIAILLDIADESAVSRYTLSKDNKKLHLT